MLQVNSGITKNTCTHIPAQNNTHWLNKAYTTDTHTHIWKEKQKTYKLGYTHRSDNDATPIHGV